jgi:hypothetical protein
VWVGSGENASQRSAHFGDGVYKSTDAGKTWKNVGLRTSEHIGKILIDPRNSNVVYVASQGPLWSAGGERGLYKTMDGGATWSAPAPILPGLDASNRTPIGYPVTQPDGSTLNAPASRRVDTFWPAVAISPSGRVYMSAYGADVVSPWQTCASAPPPPEGRINCTTLGKYIDNARLDYYVADLTTNVSQAVSTHPINTRNGFGGGFIGDYTDLAVGSDDRFHAFWTDTNNKQTVDWFYGFQFVPTLINQEDVVTATGSF